MVAPNGDILEISFDLLKPNGKVENIKIQVWDKDRRQGFDITSLFDPKELYLYANRLVIKKLSKIHLI